ncbi:hypothetical protein [uncultured Dokdonia sp.]|uniref:hypothetical protein n=1 Tax=uncultured Dokdonia sp. TaxID=575653 RepID=UPI00261EFF9E|nr:hypothetical protein [uncultured Dokdonia sp.]
MFSKNNYLKTCLVIAFFFIVILDSDLFAQIILPNDGDVDDVPVAPINGLIGLAIAVGSYLGFKKLNED